MNSDYSGHNLFNFKFLVSFAFSPFSLSFNAAMWLVKISENIKIFVTFHNLYNWKSQFINNLQVTTEWSIFRWTLLASIVMRSD